MTLDEAGRLWIRFACDLTFDTDLDSGRRAGSCYGSDGQPPPQSAADLSRTGSSAAASAPAGQGNHSAVLNDPMLQRLPR